MWLRLRNIISVINYEAITL